MLECANEYRRVTLQTIEADKKCTKAEYRCKVHPRTFHENNLVLVYDQAHDVLGHWKFEPLWHDPFRGSRRRKFSQPLQCTLPEEILPITFPIEMQVIYSLFAFR